VTRLEQRIREAILSDGPMPVSLYMTMCLHDPRDGYYATRAGFNRDFTTAPETSQVFGELLGAWVAHEWQAMGSPSPFYLCEMGPGRGTMMADMLRAARGAPGFLDAMKLVLVEASPMLKALQAEKLVAFAPEFVDNLESLPPGPAIIIGNEYLDCLPIMQFVRRDVSWHQCLVGLGEPDGLQWGMGPVTGAPGYPASENTVYEVAPGMRTLVEVLAARFATHPGRALFIDYGSEDPPNNTLRSYKDGKQLHPLAEPGASDLTADVDFGHLKKLAQEAKLAVHGPTPQLAFLYELGFAERVKALATANPDRSAQIIAAANELVDERRGHGMGLRFMAICLASAGTAKPPGF
jgi:SAM-dependent MidA family methyltransferase